MLKDMTWEGKGDCVGVLVGSASLCFCPLPQLGVQLLGRDLALLPVQTRNDGFVLRRVILMKN